MIKIVGFSPDSDPTTPGVIPDCSNLIPSLTGMEGAPSLATPNDVPALAAECRGAAVVTKLDGVRRIFAGGTAAIYELSSGSWSDISKAGGYTGGADSSWTFAQFGDTTLMANGADTIQSSTSGDFADVSGAPIAEIIFSVHNFVMALNVNDGASKPNGWHCCAAFDSTDWTEAVSTQSASGLLVSAPGEITAGGRLGEFAVAYKQNAIYLGNYVGAPDVWDWNQVVGGNAGCVGKHAWCDLDGAHFVVGDDDFWIFDGTRPQSIGNGVIREWFRNNSSANYRYRTRCVFDKTNDLVWVFFPSTNSSTLDRAIVYHIIAKRWGRVTVSTECPLEYVTPTLTIAGLDALYATIADLPDISFDSPYWITGARTLGVFNTSHQLQLFSGQTATCSLTTWEAGDDYAYSLLQGMRLRFITAPTSASADFSYKENSGDDWTAGSTVTMENNRFDILQSARWHKALINFTGPVSISGIDAQYSEDGEE